MRYPDDISRWSQQQIATRDRLAGLLSARFRLTASTAEVWATDLLMEGYDNLRELNRVSRDVAMRRGSRYQLQLSELIVSIKAERRRRSIVPPERRIAAPDNARDPKLPSMALDLAMDIINGVVEPGDADRVWRDRRIEERKKEAEE